MGKTRIFAALTFPFPCFNLNTLNVNDHLQVTWLIFQPLKLKLSAKFHDDWSKQFVSNATSPNYANYEVTHALTCLSIWYFQFIIRRHNFKFVFARDRFKGLCSIPTPWTWGPVYDTFFFQPLLADINCCEQLKLPWERNRLKSWKGP